MKLDIASRLAVAITAFATIWSFSSALAAGLNNQAQTGRVPPGASVDYTVGTGNGGALVVCEYTLNDTAQAPTYNGLPLTFVAKSTYLGVARMGVAAYVLLDPPEGTFPLVLNGSETIVGFIGSTDGVAGVDSASSAEATNQFTITDSVATTQKNDLLVMCETDSGASDDAWAHSVSTGAVFLVGSGLSLGAKTALSKGHISYTIRAGKGQPPPPSFLADVLLALSPTP